MSAALIQSGFGSSFRSLRPAPPKRRGRMAIVAAIGGGAAVAPRRTSKSLYEVLRVGEMASAGEIKAAYRALAKRFHPDVDPEGGSEFVEIRGAYEVLSDPAARVRYDRAIGGRIGFRVGEGIRFRRWETDQCW